MVYDRLTEDCSTLALYSGTEVSAVWYLPVLVERERRGSAAPRAGRSVQMCPRGPETDRCTVDEQCLSCQLRFPAWPPLLKHPSQPPPLGLCVSTLLPVDSPLSGLSHATVSNHSAHPPRTQRVGPHLQPAPQDGGGRGGDTPLNLSHLLQNRTSLQQRWTL